MNDSLKLSLQCVWNNIIWCHCHDLITTAEGQARIHHTKHLGKAMKFHFLYI